MAIPLRPALPHSRQRSEQRDERDWDVDEQAPAPTGVLGQHAAEDEADSTAATLNRTVHTERPGPLTRFDEGHGEQGQRCRGEQGRERSLQCTRPKEYRRIRGGPTEGGGTREPDQADQEHPLPSDEISDAASEQKQSTEGQRVCGDDPLSVRVRDVQTDLSVWQGDVHDGSVEHDHQ